MLSWQSSEFVNGIVLKQSKSDDLLMLGNYDDLCNLNLILIIL
jgi:hypothetical protein